MTDIMFSTNWICLTTVLKYLFLYVGFMLVVICAITGSMANVLALPKK